MNISILIPTFNRAVNLSKCIDSAIQFANSSRHNIDILVCNNVSTDGTNELLANLAKLDKRIKPFQREKFLPSGHENLVRWLEVIENNSDWYWILGDDDLLISKNINYFDDLIEIDQLDYLHVPTPDLKLNENLIMDKVSGLCDFFGFIELFSFFSNQIISKSSLNDIKKTISENKKIINYDYCFVHALVLLMSLEKKNGAISNIPFVDYQDGVPSNNSGIPWFDTAENILSLHQNNLIELPKNKEFFLSRGNFLWRMFTQWVIIDSLNKQTLPNKILYEKIQKTISLITDQEMIKSDNLMIEIAFKNLELIFNSKEQTPGSHDELKNQIIKIYNRLGEKFIRT